MKYTEKDIYEGFQFTNDYGKGKIYTCTEIGVDSLMLEGFNYPKQTYRMEKLLNLLNEEVYMPLLKKKEEINTVYEVF